MVIDSGASCNIITVKIAEQLVKSGAKMWRRKQKYFLMVAL